jgi:hypothetical protein
MSKYNNANTDHYKTSGRDPQGRNHRHEIAKQDFTQVRSEANQPSGKKKAKKKKS